jgi:hypothetical protein
LFSSGEVDSGNNCMAGKGKWFFEDLFSGKWNGTSKKSNVA